MEGVYETADVATLTANPKNVRKHPKRQIDALIDSVRQFGQIRPIVIDEDNILIAGHGLLMALKETKTETASVLRVSGLTQSQKIKLMLADNRIYELGVNDMTAIQGLLSELDDFEVPGFDPEVLAQLAAATDSDAMKEAAIAISTPDPEPNSDAASGRESVLCPRCGERVYT